MRHYTLLSHLLLMLILFGLLGAIAVQANAEESSVASATETTTESDPLPAGVVELDVEEIHCSSCAKKLTRKLFTLKGVKKIDANVKENSATINFPKESTIDAVAIWQAAIAGGTKPTILRYLDQVVTAEDMKKMLEAE